MRRISAKSRQIQPPWHMSRSQGLLAAIQVVLVCGIGLVGGQALFAMLGPTKDINRSANNEPCSLPQMPVALPAEGMWSFGDSPVCLGVEIVDSSGLSERMAIPPQRCMPGPGVSSPLDGALLSSVKRVCQQVETIGEFTAYTLTQPRLRLRVFSKGSGNNEQFAGGYLAYPRETETWTLVVGAPTPKAVPTSDQTHLLPLTDLTGSIGIRRAQDGTAQCEVIEAFGDMENLLNFWRSAGWKITSASESDGHRTLVCSRKGKHIQVQVRQDSPESLRHVLLVIDTSVLLDLEEESLWTERASL